jgi:hypothetical protein
LDCFGQFPIGVPLFEAADGPSRGTGWGAVGPPTDEEVISRVFLELYFLRSQPPPENRPAFDFLTMKQQCG